ncbi:MAG: sigma-54 dependent transcriptional regulator [Stappiaceae bacterium]
MGSERDLIGSERFCILDRDPAARRQLSTKLIALGAGSDRIFEVPGWGEAVNCLTDETIDVLFADMDTTDGTLGLADLAQTAPQTSILATSGSASVTMAVDAVSAGARDLLIKPIAEGRLADRLKIALPGTDKVATTQFGRIRSVSGRPASSSCKSTANDTAVTIADTASADRADFERFIGRSEAMQTVYKQIEKIAGSNAPAFITGESGTGKELCADALHQRSARSGHPFIAINCSAIPKDLMESEIFGHIRGSFTGAVENRAGAAELADGGTLFLDEIGEMDLALQAKLLRFIQTGAVQRVGDARTRQVDVRIICATHRDPLTDIQAGRFREDLFYRLHVLPIHLPPLRSRRADILNLANNFLATHAKEEGCGFSAFSPEAEEALLSGDWPGNVRQLENTIRQITVMNEGTRVEVSMLPPTMKRTQTHSATARVYETRTPLQDHDSIEPLWLQERRIIEATLSRFQDNIALAAAALEISPSTIYRKRQSWEAKLKNGHRHMAN